MNRETILFTNHHLREIKLKNTFSNIAAIVKFTDDDIRVIEDKFLKVPKKYLNNITPIDVMDRLIQLSIDSSAVQDCEIEASLQIFANLEANSADIKRMKYVDGNILLTISFADDLENKVRNCIVDVKCFRNFLDMKIFVLKEVNRISCGSFRSKILIDKSINADECNEQI